jgi:hypothetical protein
MAATRDAAPVADRDRSQDASPPRAWDWTWWGTITAFTVAMALVESAVVVYLRAILNIAPGPVELDASFAATMMERFPWLVPAERWREAATMVMLATLGALAGRSRRQKIGVWLYAFGLWDIFYYVWLYVLIQWPPSLLTSDILFLIPVPWIAPVLLPVTAATGMVALGLWLMAREPCRDPAAGPEREPAAA